MNFLELGLSELTIKAINEYGIDEPTTVQTDVIPSILEGKDVFTIAPSGCGKTMSYVFPLVDIISKKGAHNILIITPSSEQSVVTSDKLAIFNKYHEINEATIMSSDEEIDNEANVIIASPELLLDIIENGKVDVSRTNILIVDDINLIKKYKQLNNLTKILALLPVDKQNIVYTNRRSKETQEVLEKILKTPEEVKVDKNKEQEAGLSSKTHDETPVAEANVAAQTQAPKENNNKNKRCNKKAPRKIIQNIDADSLELSKTNNSFNGLTPAFILTKGILVDITEKK